MEQLDKRALDGTGAGVGHAGAMLDKINELVRAAKATLRLQKGHRAALVVSGPAPGPGPARGVRLILAPYAAEIMRPSLLRVIGINDNGDGGTGEWDAKQVDFTEGGHPYGGDDWPLLETPSDLLYCRAGYTDPDTGAVTWITDYAELSTEVTEVDVAAGTEIPAGAVVFAEVWADGEVAGTKNFNGIVQLEYDPSAT